ncbi:hypothetical protein DPMN_024759 [Dreissena polymorpha]|uniref:Uncharacterized protein n=1 Tax=Dreissena polymorpha TaxID=45954 RepID=A0A9D4RBX4_DREPO|nr:hypothetical protein DPMN_024759 [Dreissena polymorpha]
MLTKTSLMLSVGQHLPSFNNLGDSELKKAAPAVKFYEQDVIDLKEEYNEITTVYEDALAELEQEKQDKLKVFIKCMDSVEQALDVTEEAGQAKNTLKTSVNKIYSLLRDIFINRMCFKDLNRFKDDIPKVFAQSDILAEDIKRLQSRHSK